MESAANTKSTTAETSVVKAHHFYINIVLLNKEEALKGKVQEKAGYGRLGIVLYTIFCSNNSDDIHC
jgi:hypothetical protein